jgi:ASC-1-like (ASCH) protein
MTRLHKLILLLILIIVVSLLILTFCNKKKYLNGQILNKLHISGAGEKISDESFNNILQGLKTKEIIKLDKSDRSNKFNKGKTIIFTSTGGKKIKAKITDVTEYDDLTNCLYQEGWKDIYPNANSIGQAMDLANLTNSASNFGKLHKKHDHKSTGTKYLSINFICY